MPPSRQLRFKTVAVEIILILNLLKEFHDIKQCLARLEALNTVQ